MLPKSKIVSLSESSSFDHIGVGIWGGMYVLRPDIRIIHVNMFI